MCLVDSACVGDSLGVSLYLGLEVSSDGGYFGDGVMRFQKAMMGRNSFRWGRKSAHMLRVIGMGSLECRHSVGSACLYFFFIFHVE